MENIHLEDIYMEDIHLENIHMENIQIRRTEGTYARKRHTYTWRDIHTEQHTHEATYI